MNELLFCLHTLVMVGFGFGALRLGSTALTTWVALQSVLANLFVLKQIDFLGFHVTCSDVFAIGSILGLNLLREFYGKEAAKRALWICFFSLAFFVGMSQLHLLYTPNSYDSTQGAFETLLSPSPRLMAASLLVFFLVQQIDLRLFNLLKQRFSNFSLRHVGALVCSQLIDTVLFSLLGLWGLVADLFDIIVISFLIKLLDHRSHESFNPLF